ncbi:MAG: AAA family ATPase [Chlorobiaceae bacterium]
MDPLAEALKRPEAYPHETGTIEVVETHISLLFLTESYAYKIKKPVNLGFLDFSTLELRKHFCHEELRLNRRLCPDIYLSVVPVVEWQGKLFLDRPGEIVDYAVKMVRFDRTMELDRMIASGRLERRHIDLLADIVTGFHKGLPQDASGSGFGMPENLIRPMMENFQHMEPAASDAGEEEELLALKGWTLKEHERLRPIFLERKQDGFIRPCHGDMHTGNMVWWRNSILIFDCIEFNEDLSIIDVTSDLAFLFMDLEHAGKPAFAWRILNRWLQATGDYQSLRLLRFYALYRAMVRAKVTAIRYGQSTGKASAQKALDEHRSYLELARRYTLRQQAVLVITFGVSGSGKSHWSAELAERLPAVHLRSDIERKRLVGLDPLQRSQREIYSAEMTRATYRRMLDIAESCLREGIAVIADATFLDLSTRKQFIELATRCGSPCGILGFEAPVEILGKRVEKRYREGRDASEADIKVLYGQLERREPLSSSEEALCIKVNSAGIVDISSIAAKLNCLRERVRQLKSDEG